MFPDSEIAKSYQKGETKTKYYTSFLVAETATSPEKTNTMGIGLNAKKKLLLLIVVHTLMVMVVTHNLWIITLRLWKIWEWIHLFFCI